MADLKISATFPGEYLAAKILDFIIAMRESRSPELNARLDAIGVEIVERGHRRLSKLLGETE